MSSYRALNLTALRRMSAVNMTYAWMVFEIQVEALITTQIDEDAASVSIATKTRETRAKTNS